VIKKRSDDQGADRARKSGGARRLRADAQRSVDAIVAAAKELFAMKGVDATTREIADRAGVGMGTLFRRFPKRADLIGAVFEGEMNACADAATTLARENPPFEALAKWMQLYVRFISAKRGLAKAISSDDPVYVGMYARFDQRIHPAARELYEAAVAAGDVRGDLDAAEVLAAVSTLCMSSYEGNPDHSSQMVTLLMEGLASPRRSARVAAKSHQSRPPKR